MSESEDVPRTSRYEVTRAASFVTVFQMMERYGVSPEVTIRFIEPYDEIITFYSETYGVTPVIEENPVDVIEPDLKRMGLFDNDGMRHVLDSIREFFEENPDILPMELEYTPEPDRSETEGSAE